MKIVLEINNDLDEDILYALLNTLTDCLLSTRKLVPYLQKEKEVVLTQSWTNKNHNLIRFSNDKFLITGKEHHDRKRTD